MGVYLKNNVSIFEHLEFGNYMTIKYISKIITQWQIQLLKWINYKKTLIDIVFHKKLSWISNLSQLFSTIFGKFIVSAIELWKWYMINCRSVGMVYMTKLLWALVYSWIMWFFFFGCNSTDLVQTLRTTKQKMTRQSLMKQDLDYNADFLFFWGSKYML